MIVLPLALAALGILLILLGQFAIPTAAMLVLWGLFTTPTPVAWGTWMTRVIPDDLEAGGGLQVALVQVAITFGALAGGLLFDTAGWSGPFVLAAALLVAAAALAAKAASFQPISTNRGSQ